MNIPNLLAGWGRGGGGTECEGKGEGNRRGRRGRGKGERRGIGPYRYFIYPSSSPGYNL